MREPTRVRLALGAAAMLLLSGCGQLVPERPRPLISDEQAGSDFIYLTGEEDTHRKLESLADGARQLLLEEGSFRSASMTELNNHFHDTLVIPADRQVLAMMMPGDGGTSVDLAADRIVFAMTNDGMSCWGILVLPEETLRTAVFAPGCSAEDLTEAEWTAEWPSTPEPISSEESIEFGTRPRG